MPAKDDVAELLLIHFMQCDICKAASLHGGALCIEGQRLVEEANRKELKSDVDV